MVSGKVCFGYFFFFAAIGGDVVFGFDFLL